MTREDEYTVTFSSGKIVMLISGALCAMLACFIIGLLVGRSAQPQVAAPTPAPAPEPAPALTKQPAPTISLPEVPKTAEPPKPAEPASPAATAPPEKTVAKKPAPAPAPAPEPVKKAPAAPKELFAICVSSVENKDGAQQYANTLSGKGYKASVMRTQSKSGAILYRTVIGEFPTREIAEQQLTALKSKGEFKDAFVITK